MIIALKARATEEEVAGVCRRIEVPGLTSHLSHGTGEWEIVSPMARAAVAAGADGIVVEVYPRSAEALSDGPQALLPSRFRQLRVELARVAAAVDRSL